MRRKHRVQCTVRDCRRHYVAAVLCPKPFSSRPIFPTFPVDCLCPEHLERYIHTYLATTLPTRSVLLAQATRYLR